MHPEIMKKFRIYILLFCLSIFIIKIYGQQPANNHLKIMSYNICGWGLTPDNKKGVIDIINKHKPDIIGLQEVDSLWYRCETIIPHDVTKDFARACSMYGYFAADRYITKESLEKVVSNGCKLPKDSFPNYIGTGYGNAVLAQHKPLHATKIILNHIYQALQIVEYDNYVFFNTHLINGRIASYREEAARRINEIAKGYNKPIFLVGDLNVDPKGDKTINILLKEWVLLSDPTKPTTHATPPKKGSTFDFILAYTGKDQNGNPRYFYNVVDEEVLSGKYSASDHYPLKIEVVFSNTKPFEYIKSETINKKNLTIHGDIIIRSGANLKLISSNLTINPKSTIIVERGATLTVTASNIYNGNIIVKKGGKLIVNKKGAIYIDKFDNIDIREGGSLKSTKGFKKIIE